MTTRCAWGSGPRTATLVDWTRLYPETFVGFQARPFLTESALLINPQTVLPNAVSKVLTFSLVNASPGVVIRTLVNGSLVDLSDLAAQGHVALDIRANVTPANGVQSVRFYSDNVPPKPDNTANYEIGDTEDTNGNLFSLVAGTHVIRVLPCSADNASGLTGVPLTLRFTVQNRAVASRRAGPDETRAGSHPGWGGLRPGFRFPWRQRGRHPRPVKPCTRTVIPVGCRGPPSGHV